MSLSKITSARSSMLQLHSWKWHIVFDGVAAARVRIKGYCSTMKVLASLLVTVTAFLRNTEVPAAELKLEVGNDGLKNALTGNRSSLLIFGISSAGCSQSALCRSPTRTRRTRRLSRITTCIVLMALATTGTTSRLTQVQGCARADYRLGSLSTRLGNKTAEYPAFFSGSFSAS